MSVADRCTAMTTLLVLAVLTGCEHHPVVGAPAPEAASTTRATPAEVLQRLRDLGGEYRLDRHNRVWALSFHRCRLNDGDLEVVRSLPAVRTMTLRGVSVAGGKLSTTGLQPLESLQQLRRLDLSMNDFSGHLSALASLPQLEFLDLRGTEFGDEAMLAVARMPNLRTLHLGHLELSERGLKALRGSPVEKLDYWLQRDQDVVLLGGLANLRSWFIGYGDVPMRHLPALAGCRQLQEITLTCHDGCPVESIDALRSMRSLKKVQIAGPADDAWPILAALDGLAELKSLRLVNIGDRALRQLPSLASLETLDLSLSPTGSSQGLQKLVELPAIRHLALQPTTTTAGGLVSVSRCATLQTLVFEPNLVGEFLHVMFRQQRESTPGFAAADLRPVLRQTALETLRVDRLGFGDELMSELGAAQKLQYLGLSGLPITDTGLEFLRHLKHLQVLDIADTSVSFEAAEALHRDYLPQCRITDNWCCGCMTMEPLP